MAKFLSEHHIPFKVASHKPVYNIAEASEAEGIHPSKVVKNILMKDEKGFFLIVLCGDTRCDFDKIRDFRRTKRVRMATPEEVKTQTGVDVGAVNLFSCPEVIADNGVLKLKEINCHPDDNTKTIYFPVQYLKDVLPHLDVADIAQ